MVSGILFALAAGIMWGLIFVGPLWVPEYPAALQSAGRYVAFGVVALPLAWHSRDRLHRLTRADWVAALKLAAIGNLLYYLALASAIQRVGAPVAAMIIGTLPVVIAVAANLFYGHHEGRLAWRSLLPALLLIAIGLMLVNVTELHTAKADIGAGRYALGLAFAVAAVACWTWYPLRNGRWLRQHPQVHPATWATAQGLATLPLALVAYLIAGVWLAITTPDFALPLGPRPAVFVPLMLAIGLLCSWLGTLCWNAASQRLPTVLIGPLVVFETLFGLAYAFLWRQSWPPLPTIAGVIALVAGVVLALRLRPQTGIGPI